MAYRYFCTRTKTVSIVFIIQTFFAVLVIGIALWTVFCLLKELLPHKKIMAVLSVVTIIGIILYSQAYKSSDTDDNTYVDTKRLFANNESADDEEYEDNCSELPQYCYEMNSCSQAEEAFECGNYDLDGDDDGVPCESLCGSY